MNNKRSIAIALAVVVIMGLGSLTLNPQMLPFAAGPKPSAEEHAHDAEQGHSEEPGHADEQGHGNEAKKPDAAASEPSHEEEE
ncbi:efflux RND transporter periplasmic adaptor subunit, partial [Pseudomonas syringae]|nr:efflux RND transporter periplasmic adaptor subunit [Pseudomonas syringae]